MRLFVAIDIDEAARQALGNLQRQVGEALGDHRADLTWVRPEHQHLTLAFVGDVDEPQAARIGDAVARPIARAPFAADVGGLGIFPPQGAPRVLWVGLRRGAAETTEVADEVAQRLRAIGVHLEGREFRPHLTLGRWRTARGPDRRRLERLHAREVIATIRVESVTLYLSRPSASGPAYTPLARGPLQAE